MDLSEFDGLGHYRKTVEDSEQLPRPEPPDDGRPTYNPGRSMPASPAPAEPWMLGTYDGSS